MFSLGKYGPGPCARRDPTPPNSFVRRPPSAAHVAPSRSWNWSSVDLSYYVLSESSAKMKGRHQFRRRFSLQPSFMKEDHDEDRRPHRWYIQSNLLQKKFNCYANVYEFNKRLRGYGSSCTLSKHLKHDCLCSCYDLISPRKQIQINWFCH